MIAVVVMLLVCLYALLRAAYVVVTGEQVSPEVLAEIQETVAAQRGF